MDELTQQVLNFANSSFKYILIIFNFMTLIVVYIHKNRQKRSKQHHVLFVTAHPDDEVMFFRPSLSSINKDYFVHLLCLTGKNTARQQQLKKVKQKYQLHKYECLDNQKLRDSESSNWPSQQIRQIVLKYVQENNIKAIFTFDAFGVSGHSNHQAIFLALSALHYPIQQLKILNKKNKNLTQEDKLQIQKIKKQSIKIYHLQSVNLIRKYTGIFEIIFALLRDFSWINLNFVDGFDSMALHKSQFVWYRKLWVFFSQYAYINVYNMTRMKTNNSEKNSTNSTQNQQAQTQPLKATQQKKEK